MADKKEEVAEVPDFNEKQLQVIQGLLAQNAKALEDKFSKSQSELMEKLASLQSKTPEKDVKSKKDSIEEDPRIAKLASEHEALKKAYADKEAKEKALIRKQAIHDVLTAKGVPAGKVKYAEAWLEKSNLIDHEDDDVKFVDGSLKVDLKSGLSKWLKTDDGQEFLPAKGIQGSGAIKPLNGSSSASKSEKTIEDHLKDVFSGAGFDPNS